MDLIVGKDKAIWGNKAFPCAIGRAGVIPAHKKREGDGATPVREWLMREVFYRADKINPPEAKLPLTALNPDDGWSDDPSDSAYNRKVRHPYPASAEKLWLEDGVYDIIVVLGYNDAPVVAGKGSAIFLHVARPDYFPTAGCVALSLENLMEVLQNADKTSRVIVNNGLFSPY